MTWLGKILVFVVMLMALAWVWLTATDYTTRVNWKAQRDAYKKGFDEAVAARDSDYKRHQAELAALNQKSESLEKDLAASKATVDTLARANREAKAKLDEVITATSTVNQTVVQLQTVREALEKELTTVRERNNKLEADRLELTVSREQARRDELAARNDANLANKKYEDLSRQNEDLRNTMAELRANGGRPGPLVGPRAPTVPENLRGTVTAVEPGAPDLVELSIGLDAGLTFGSELDLYRLSGGGKHLGTVVVTHVYAKKAVARFRPADGRPIGRLRPDELPRVGDTVSKLTNGGTALR